MKRGLGDGCTWSLRYLCDPNAAAVVLLPFGLSVVCSHPRPPPRRRLERQTELDAGAADLAHRLLLFTLFYFLLLRSLLFSEETCHRRCDGLRSTRRMTRRLPPRICSRPPLATLTCPIPHIYAAPRAAAASTRNYRHLYVNNRSARLGQSSHSRRS